MYDRLARVRPQLQFIKLEVAKARAEVERAENDVPNILAALPSVKLPTSKSWMSQTRKAGSDGTIEIVIMESGPGISVQQTWMGGDGSMTGTVILTTIPYDDIGNIELVPPSPIGTYTWTVRVHAARAPFPQKIDSPQRRTIKATFPAVNYETTKSSLYFYFDKPAEAQDAYAYFLYHKQLADEVRRDPVAAQKCNLDNSEKRCKMTSRDPNPPTASPQEAENEYSTGGPKMNARIVTFSSYGDTTLLEYDPATADMDEVNRVIAEYEAKTGAQPFDMETGERIARITRQQNEVLMVHPIAGG